MTRTGPSLPRTIEARPAGNPPYRVWSTLLVILIGGCVFVGLMATLFNPKPGAVFSPDGASREEGAFARAELSVPQRPGAGVRAVSPRTAEPTPAGNVPLGVAARSSHRGVSADPASRTAGQPGEDTSSTGSDATPDGFRAWGALAGIRGSDATAAPDQASPVPPPSADTAGQYGIEVASLRMTAGGNVLDLRYKVVDPTKAAKIGRDGGSAYLLDEAGRRISRRNVQAIGGSYSARHLDRPGNVYSTWFANHGGLLQSGDLVGVVMGDLHIANVRVE